jgi:hypothetical protein
MARFKGHDPADPIRLALARDWRRRLRIATKLGKRAKVRAEWLEEQEWRRDPAKVEAARREQFRAKVSKALVGREHWIRAQVEARKAKPPQKKRRPEKQKRIRPGPKMTYRWDVLDNLFKEDIDALAATLRQRYKDKTGGFDIEERVLNKARQWFRNTGKSRPTDN